MNEYARPRVAFVGLELDSAARPSCSAGLTVASLLSAGQPKRSTTIKLLYLLYFFLFLFQGDITQFQHKQFTEFLLVVESVVGGDLQQNALEANNAEEAVEVIMASSKRTGSFQLLGDVLTRFSDHCTNTVTQTSSVGKSEIQVLWTAPPAGSGCVTFKATVVENK